MNTKALVFTGLALASLLLSTSLRAADSPALGEPAKSVLDHYLKVQTELAADSTKSVADHATAIGKAVRDDQTKAFPPEVAKQADVLAKAKDLKAARAAFKPLSTSLIKYMAAHKLQPNTIHEAFCPMAEASWLQSGKTIKNPYFGKEMLSCGELKN